MSPATPPARSGAGSRTSGTASDIGGFAAAAFGPGRWRVRPSFPVVVLVGAIVPLAISFFLVLPTLLCSVPASSAIDRSDFDGSDVSRSMTLA